MRSTWVAGLILALGAVEAKAEDWRALSLSHHDVVFVDADSVRRQADGRIAFRARHRLAENESNRDFGYDRIDLAVAGRCSGRGGEPPPATSARKLFLRGRTVSVGWREEELAEDAPRLAELICRGMIGYRSFADLDRAMAEYDRHDSLERLAAYVTGEVELTGTVVQGWEMNAVSLCGSEAGCTADAPRETCWLEGNINVPAPAGAPERVDGRPVRDSAGAVFTGRIYRSRSQGGFGHVGASACLVEATGPARFVEIAQPRPPAADAGATARPAEAAAAHAALARSIRAAALVGLGSDGRNWTLDELSPGLGGDGNPCFSVARFQGTEAASAPVLGWFGVAEIVRRGPAVTLVSYRSDDGLESRLAHSRAAEGIAAFVRRLSDRGVAGLAQQGARVTARFRDGTRQEFRFADSAEAVRAAGIAGRLPGLEVAQVVQYGNRVTIVAAHRKTLAFPHEAGAAEAMRHMEALRAACGANEWAKAR